jgi:hypothetical protein
VTSLNSATPCTTRLPKDDASSRSRAILETAQTLSMTLTKYRTLARPIDCNPGTGLHLHFYPSRPCRQLVHNNSRGLEETIQRRESRLGCSRTTLTSLCAPIVDPVPSNLLWSWSMPMGSNAAACRHRARFQACATCTAAVSIFE